MTRVFLAAGVAAMAIAAPASAGPRDGGGDRRPNMVVNRAGGPRMAAARMQPRFAPQRMARPAFAARRMPEFAARRVAPQRMALMERQHHAFRAPARPQVRMAAREQMRVRGAQVHSRLAARQQLRTSRMQAHNRMLAQRQLRANHVQAHSRLAAERQQRLNRLQQAQNLRATRARQAQNARAMRQQLQASRTDQARNRMALRQQVQANRLNQAQNRMAMRQQLQASRINGAQALASRAQFQANRQSAARTLLAQRLALQPDRLATSDAFRASRFAALAALPRTRVVDPVDAVRFVGQPVSVVTNYVPLEALPASVSYLYPDTPSYYYQYGGGYLYQVDRSTSLIDALIPLLAGGFMPGTYLPTSYMSSYVPAYYGLNSFYPADYGNTCSRYAYGVVYEVDCATGMVEDVVPLYAGGYGVGQVLPSAYSYYNVPMQYRSLYYPTADYSYWYAPGAIYQYDPRTSLITSVAALMAPGFTVGQPMPAGYSMYNVPLAYRSTYYDTPTAWYRYNNGYIYQIDPTTMLVTSVVASLLT